MIADPFVGEIRQFGFRMIPMGWWPCDGSILQSSMYPDLSRLLGSKYGGDGVTTFGLPDLRGRAPLGISNQYPQGATLGEESVALTGAYIPKHSHWLLASDSNAKTNQIKGNALAVSAIYAPGSNIGYARPETIAPCGTTAHNNMQPSLVTNFCIALTGTPVGAAKEI